MTTAELLKFKRQLDLSPEAFSGITGVSIHQIRRGRVRGDVPISLEQKETIARCMSLAELALQLCGSDESALDWIYAPAPSLAGSAPIDLTGSPKDYAKIEGLIRVLKNSLPEPVVRPEPTFQEPKEKLRIAERLKEARSKRDEMTKAHIARLMQAKGFKKMTGGTIGRYEIGYEAPWSEIKALAEILEVDARWLGKV